MKVRTAVEAASMISDGAVPTVDASRGPCCPDEVSEAIGERYESDGAPVNLTRIHPIAAGNLFGTRGVDHLARPGCLGRIIGGSYPSGPSNADLPQIRKMIGQSEFAANRVPSGIVIDMPREAGAKRPGILTRVGMDTFVDPRLEGCAMHDAARAKPIVRRENSFLGVAQFSCHFTRCCNHSGHDVRPARKSGLRE